MEYYKDLKLDEFQKQAIQAINQHHNIIVAAPTGSGKTLIGEYAIEKALAEGRKVIYTSPIKALSNQKFRDFTSLYGNLIGIMTGDVTINPDAQVLIMTTEVLRNTIFENPKRLEDIHYVIFDEIHYMDDVERGTVWEESIIFAPLHIKFLALSATISNLEEFAQWMESIRYTKITLVREEHRPVPLHHYLVVDGEKILTSQEYLQNPIPKKRKKKRKKKPPPLPQINQKLVEYIASQNHLPCIFFMFSRAACEQMAKRTATQSYLNKSEQYQMGQLLQHSIQQLALSDEEIKYAKEILQLLQHGVAYHHAGLLPAIKELVERCFSSGLVKFLFATETFALGINMPARCVAFESLRKFNGIRETYIKARDYQQMAGRAGRRGIDNAGYIYSSISSYKDIPKHVKHVISGQAEQISSRFNLDYSTLLNLYHRLKENFFEAWEKSFANFRAKKQNKTPHWYNQMLQQVQGKLQVLHEMHYIHQNQIQEKGLFAMKISGYEIHISELYFRGILSQLDPVQLNILFSAVVYEGRADHFPYKYRFRLPSKIRKNATYILQVFAKNEHKYKISPTIKELDFSMSYATQLWSEGKELSYICQRTNQRAGDVVRNLRRIVQVLRQLEKALENEERHDPFLLDHTKEAISLLKRDMVDAEKQLKQGLQIPDETTIAAALRKAGLLK